jgi:hypothetical protein
MTEVRCCVCGGPFREGECKVSRGLRGWAHTKCAVKEMPRHMEEMECKSKN